MSSSDTSFDDGVPRRSFVFEVTEAELIEASRATDKERSFFETMKAFVETYKRERKEYTADLQITKDAYDRIQGRLGLSDKQYSRLVRILEDGKETYHVIPSAWITIPEIRTSTNPDRVELILQTRGLNFIDGRQIRFQLIPINAQETAPVEDRTDIFPDDLVRVSLIPNTTAEMLVMQKG